MRIEFYSNVAK